MNYLGIDPGQTGGMVLLAPKGGVLFKTPISVNESGELDKEMFCGDLNECSMFGEFHTFLERIVPFALSPKGALTFGRQLGMIEAFLWQMKLPVMFIEPQKWSKEMHQGIDKDLKPKVRTKIAIERLFPGVNLLATERSKVPHEGLSDALLIAEYGRRTMK